MGMNRLQYEVKHSVLNKDRVFFVFMIKHIQGRNYTYNIGKYRYADCGNEFDESLEQENRICPSCRSS